MLGKTDIPLHPLTIGLWQAGGDLWQYQDDAILASLKAAYEAGIASFDTARAYGNGHAETLLGQALKNQRDQVLIASKVIQKLNYNNVMNACNAALQCLQTDYLDLLYIHWPSGSFGEKRTPIEETLKAFNALKKAGKIRAIGVSNFDLVQLKEAEQYAQIDAVQNPCSILWQRGQDVVDYCQQNQITFFAYSALASGLLTGKYRTLAELQASQPLRSYMTLATESVFAKLTHLFEMMESLSDKYQTTFANIALAWLMSHRIHPIVGVSKPEQAMSNALSVQIKMDQTDVTELGKLGQAAGDCVTTERMWDLAGIRDWRAKMGKTIG